MERRLVRLEQEHLRRASRRKHTCVLHRLSYTSPLLTFCLSVTFSWVTCRPTPPLQWMLACRFVNLWYLRRASWLWWKRHLCKQTRHSLICRVFRAPVRSDLCFQPLSGFCQKFWSTPVGSKLRSPVKPCTRFQLGNPNLWHLIYLLVYADDESIVIDPISIALYLSTFSHVKLGQLPTQAIYFDFQGFLCISGGYRGAVNKHSYDTSRTLKKTGDILVALGANRDFPTNNCSLSPVWVPGWLCLVQLMPGLVPDAGALVPLNICQYIFSKHCLKQKILIQILVLVLVPGSLVGAWSDTGASVPLHLPEVFPNLQQHYCHRQH